MKVLYHRKPNHEGLGKFTMATLKIETDSSFTQGCILSVHLESGGRLRWEGVLLHLTHQFSLLIVIRIQS